MFRYLKQNPNILLLLLLSVWMVLNFITACSSEIIADEAYYWVLSKNLDFGYFDHPPLVAFFLRLGTSILGNSELGVRFFTILLHFATLYIFWKVARPKNATYLTALKYFLICFSLPLLHIYGFVATPDTPLLFSIAVTLLVFRYFIENQSSNLTTQLKSILYLSLGFALMAYSKYHGVLIVISLIIAYPRLLKSWMFYAAGFLTLLLYLPHLHWQYAHDFVSFKYHLASRNDPFQWKYLSEYILNFFGAYNPLLTVPFCAILWKIRPKKDEILRRYYWISAIFILLFFLYSTHRGHVQAQWMLPVVFPMIFLLLEKSELSAKFSKYLYYATGGFGLLLLGVHIVVIMAVQPILPNIGLSGVAAATARAGLTIRGVSDIKDTKRVEAFIMDGEYDFASLFNFYSTMPTYGSPSIYDRSSQYEFINFTDTLYNRCVAIEVSMAKRRDMTVEDLQSQFQSVTVPTIGTRYYKVCEDYIPTQRVSIEPRVMPDKVLSKSDIALDLTFTNPYSHDIPLGNSQSDIRLIAHLRALDGDFVDIILPVKNDTVLRGSSTSSFTTSLKIPELETNNFHISFTLQLYPFGSPHNSQIFDMMVVNPRNRI